MDPTSEFVEPAFDPVRFFSEYWRRKPMFIRGGAESFLGRRFTGADFDAAYAAATAAGADIRERAGEVTFIENVSAHVPDLLERAGTFGADFAAPKTWFDAIRTYSPSGIGAHFDHSDNFVLQQEGVKHWTLAAPEHLDQADIAKRMLNVPGVGGHEIPDGQGVLFTLEPGDLLYLPLFWLHHGVSDAASLSLSLVCPAVSLYAAVMPFVGQVVRSRALGHQPISALHAYLSDEERASAVSEIRRATVELLRRISDAEVADLVCSLQRERLPGARV
ncbi:JmjC domain-containing protein [Actinokineospora xionganensis]|uniref:Cupin-like domain-containing protein n=1 Tax=Actinokineospora xionganensis TaxID=2684470 RepID=A0ABR7L0U0_9PSEU|nr:cupin domain-containing protein [Actinokineospora xionganensis]MBC6446016.1 cupin-like domain-containing protein [Actinokineospora xionganensis]